MFPFSLFLFPSFFPSYYYSFSFFSPSRSRDHQSSGKWRKSVENKFQYKNIKNKGKKNTYKKYGRNIRTNLFSYYMSAHAHVIVWQENTGLQAKQKKDKRNNRKLLTNRKQCYIIQSSTRDKRNKIK